MRLFPTVHATGDLPALHRAHIERHGLTFVGAQYDPDVVLVLAGTEPAGPTAGTGVVVLASGDERPDVTRLLAEAGVITRPEAATGAVALVAADPTADDLLA